MLIKNQDIIKLSEDIRKIIDGKDIDLRDNREGPWSVLKNDIHSLANIKNQQADSLRRERNIMADSLANISHQLKTPLTSMMIMAELLENAPPHKQEEFISNIQAGLHRMEWLVSALLKMARLDAGAVEFSKTKVQAREIAELAALPLQILLDVKSQELEIFCDTELLCDKKWTAEALTNVIKNASEHSPEGGKILIESGANPICQWISVADSGKGIGRNEMARLFNRFKGSCKGEGYGIGLPLGLQIMRSQNGDIEVEAGGNGSGARLTLKFFK